MSNVIIKGVDCATPITKTVAEGLAATGYGFVCRYLVPKGHPKRLTVEEAQLLTEVGLYILNVFETKAQRMSASIGYDTSVGNGTEDGKLALAAAAEIGVPKSAYIYFAIDFDSSEKDWNAIEGYLRAAATQITGYGIGVYAEHDVINEMYSRGICDGYWQAYAWANGKGVSEHANVHQYSGQRTLTFDNGSYIEADLDEAYNMIGMWNYNTECDDLKITTIKAIMNGKETELPSINYNGENYVRVRSLAEAQTDDKLTVDWDAVKKRVVIESK